MINSIFNLCQKVNFEINLFELVKGLSTLVTISMIVLVVKKIIKEKEIDRRVRESSARIAQAVTEIEGYKDISKTKQCNEGLPSTIPTKIEDTKPMIKNGDLNIKEEGPSIQEVPNKIQEEKKTRAMSMEERWAEYDKKRAIRNTA